MREIVLDTETTGFDPKEGHRIVEIGAVEILNLLPTGRTYHQYINPERSMPKEAFDIHGLGDDFLRGQPVFSDVAEAFLAFIGEDAQLIIHNAEFDMRMINAELGLIGRPAIPMERATDTLRLARNKFPGAQANLDALCRRFQIDNSSREKHGALLDSELLAEVYLELRGGRQHGMTLEVDQSTNIIEREVAVFVTKPRPQPLPSRLTEEEREAHLAFIDDLKYPIWKREGSSS